MGGQWAGMGGRGREAGRACLLATPCLPGPHCPPLPPRTSPQTHTFLSTQLAATVQQHVLTAGELATGVRYAAMPGATRDSLTAVWTQWVQEVGGCRWGRVGLACGWGGVGVAGVGGGEGAVVGRSAHGRCAPTAAATTDPSRISLLPTVFILPVDSTGAAPPGNLPANRDTWVPTRKPPPPEVRLTGGKGLADLTCGLDELITAVVNDHKERDDEGKVWDGWRLLGGGRCGSLTQPAAPPPTATPAAALPAPAPTPHPCHLSSDHP